MPARFEHALRTAHVKKALVLAGKASRRQILCRGGTTDRDRNIGTILRFQLAVGFADLVSNAISTGCGKHNGTRCRRPFREQGNPGFVDPVEELVQRLPRPRLGECFAISLGGEGESIRNPDTLI